jgi:hypothetical protein
LGYETKFNIESTDFTVPYQIEHDIGSTIWDVAEELTNLYMTYQTYYDEDGYLVFRRKPILSSDTVAWDFSLDNTKYLIQSIKNTYSDKNVKNYVKIWGKLKDDGSQASYEIEVRDANYPNCPFTIEKLGEPFTRDLVISEDNYYTEEQCQLRCEYEVEKHTNMAETIELVTLPIYSLSVGSLIYVDKTEENITGKFAVTNISSGLSYDSTMTISAYKIY